MLNEDCMKMMEIEKVQALKVTNKNAAIDVLYNIGMFVCVI